MNNLEMLIKSVEINNSIVEKLIKMKETTRDLNTAIQVQLILEDILPKVKEMHKKIVG